MFVVNNDVEIAKSLVLLASGKPGDVMSWSIVFCLLILACYLGIKGGAKPFRACMRCYEAESSLTERPSGNCQWC